MKKILGAAMAAFLFLNSAVYAEEGLLKSTPAAGTSDKNYLLEPGDRINLKIYPEDDYLKGGEMEISSEGNITLPLVGKVAVAGRTLADAQSSIMEVLSQDYLVNPEVVIEVLQYQTHSFVVLGQVKKPGTYEIPPGKKTVTLLQAISLAGGFSEIANIKKIKIMRKGGGSNQVLQANAEAIISGQEQDVELEAGDVVHVSESLF